MASLKAVCEKIKKSPGSEAEKPKGILKKVTFQTDSHQEETKSEKESKEQFNLSDKVPKSSGIRAELEQMRRLYESQVKENASLREQGRQMKAGLAEAQGKVEQLKAEAQYLKSAGKEAHFYAHSDLNKKYNQTLSENYKLIQEQENLKHQYGNKINVLTEENRKLRNDLEQARNENSKLNVLLPFTPIG